MASEEAWKSFILFYFFGKILNRNQRILFVFLKRLCGRAIENGLQKVVTKKTN